MTLGTFVIIAFIIAVISILILVVGIKRRNRSLIVLGTLGAVLALFRASIFLYAIINFDG